MALNQPHPNVPQLSVPGLPPSVGTKRGGRSLSRRRLWLFRLIAVLGLPLLLLITVETTLRVSRFGYDSRFLTELSGRPGYVTDNYKFAWRFFPRALARTPQPLVIAEAKPADVVRIVVFGGSAAMGDPEAAFGMPRVLERLLSGRFPQKRFEIVNAAVTAINSHVVQSIAADCRRLDADAWVIYMGNNEVHGPFGAGTVFTDTETPRWLIRSGLALKKTKIGQLLSGNEKSEGVPSAWGGMKMFLDHKIRHDSPALEKVYANYRKNLVATLKMANRCGAKPIVSTVVTNLRDFPPFVSFHREGLGQQAMEQWETVFREGCRHQEENRVNEAIASFNAAAEIDDAHAELMFRLGECLDAVGSTEEARAMFIRSRDLDGLRFRADSKINDTIREVTRGWTNVYFVDAEAQFQDLGGSRITGNDFLYEHVHFNFAGNYQLARLLGDRIVTALGLASDGQHGDGWPAIENCADLLGFSPYHKMTVAQEVQSRLSVPPFDAQIYQQRRMQRLTDIIASNRRGMTTDAKRMTMSQYERLIADYPDDWHLRWQYASLLESTGNLTQAINHQEQVTNLLPNYAQGFFSVGALQNREKRYAEAADNLRKAIALRPSFAQARNSLGIALSHLDRTDDAIDQFEAAVALRPNYAEAFLNWGLVLAHGGDESAAVEQYQAAAKADPDYLPAHTRLAKHFAAEQNFEEALSHYKAITRLRPNDAETALNLGMLYLKLENRLEANKQFERVLRIDPNNRFARQALGRLN